MKKILANEADDWVIRRIDQPTIAQTFKGETRKFDHYYRIYTANGEAIKYCKFQQIERLASILGKEVEELPLVE